MKRSTKGTKMLQAYSWRSSPFEFPHKECHRKARENPWTLEGGRTSESSTVLYPTLWPSPAKDCIARKADPEDPQRSESLAGPRSLWRESRNSGRNSHFFEGKAHCPPQERGFHCFFLHRGEDPQVSQTPGSPQRGRETEEGFSPKSPRENQRPHAQRKPRDSEGGIPGDLIAIDTSKVTPFLERCRGNSRESVLPPRSPTSVEWWNGSIGPSGRVLWPSEDEVDLGTMRFHLKKWTEEVENRKRRDSSLGRGALGGAEKHRTCLRTWEGGWYNVS